jgi:hypothetical protein
LEKLNIVQGDSVTIAIVLPSDKMAQVEEVVVYLGNKIVAKKSDSTLISTNINNIFHIRLSSTYTQNISGQFNLVTSIDYSDLGVRKVRVEDSLLLNVHGNNNQFSNNSISTTVSATVTIVIVDNNLIQDVVIANVYRGYSTLDLYRIEKNLPNATFEEMMYYYAVQAYNAKNVSITITNLGDGATITHNLGGRVLSRFVDTNGEILNNVRGVYLNDNQVTLRTPILDDILNQTYTGKMLFEIY